MILNIRRICIFTWKLMLVRALYFHWSPTGWESVTGPSMDCQYLLELELLQENFYYITMCPFNQICFINVLLMLVSRGTPSWFPNNFDHFTPSRARSSPTIFSWPDQIAAKHICINCSVDSFTGRLIYGLLFLRNRLLRNNNFCLYSCIASLIL